MAFRNRQAAEGGNQLRNTSLGFPTANGLSFAGWIQLPIKPGQSNTPRCACWLSTSTTEPDNFEFMGSHYFVSGPAEAAPVVGSRCGLTGGSGFPQVAQMPAAIGTWYFIGYSFNAGNNLSSGYIAPEGSTAFAVTGFATQAGTVQATENCITVGDPSSGITLTSGVGAVANLRLWTRVLSANELLAEMLSEFPVVYKNLFAWWPLRNSNQSGTVKGTDLSGNGNHLTTITGGNFDWPDPQIYRPRSRRLRRSTAVLGGLPDTNLWRVA